MFTFREIAEELGITKEAVAYHYKAGEFKASRFKNRYIVDDKEAQRFMKKYKKKSG